MMTDSDSCPSSPEISVQNGETPGNAGEVSRRQLFRNKNPLSDKTNVDLILQEVRKTNTSLADFSSRMDAVESRLKSVEQQQKDVTISQSSSGDSSAERAKKKVPTRIRVSSVNFVLFYQQLRGTSVHHSMKLERFIAR